jgi:hypothetical protein
MIRDKFELIPEKVLFKLLTIIYPMY